MTLVSIYSYRGNCVKSPLKIIDNSLNLVPKLVIKQIWASNTASNLAVIVEILSIIR